MGKTAHSLKRKPATRRPKRCITIFSEGAKTEVDYLRALQRLFGLHTLIDINLIAPAGVAYTVAQKASEFAKRSRTGKKRDSFEENDEVWAVFDRDQHPKYQEAVDLCNNFKVGVARSNPCFELWLILHFKDYDGGDDRFQLQSRLKIICPEYDPDKNKSVNCDQIMPHLNQAELRAKKQIARRNEEAPPFNPPYTTFGYLTQSIKKAALAAKSLT